MFKQLQIGKLYHLPVVRFGVRTVWAYRRCDNGDGWTPVSTSANSTASASVIDTDVFLCVDFLKNSYNSGVFLVCGRRVAENDQPKFVVLGSESVVLGPPEKV
ncbi:MAG: hypothetical protein WC761_00195 [Candidatus Paceibacterota bacterium]|jgi:hypothetical protein